MLRQVNIDGVLYKIGDSRFEGDNLAYIQLPETITVGTPLTDLAPIQKALDSTDGSLLYAPSLNVFFAPTASSTPATTRIWASTTGDKGYQLKATLNASGVLQSAVVVEASEHPVVIYSLMDLIPAMQTDSILEPITTPAALAVAKAIRQDNWEKIQFLNYSMMGKGGIHLQIQPLIMQNVTDAYYFEEFKIGESDMGLHCRIYYSDNTFTTITGIAIANDGNSIPLDTWVELRQATEVLTTDLFVDSQKAVDYGIMIYELCCVQQYISKPNFLIADQNPALGDRGYVYINTKSKTLSDGKQYHIYHFELEDYKGDLRVSDGTTEYPIYNIDIYTTNVGGNEHVKGLRIEGLPLEDCVKVSKEYMEVPTGHAPHTCLEASVSGTTLNITHKNESHISSVIHVPKSVLFTSPNAFELKFAPVSMFTNAPVPYTPDAKIEISKDGINWTQPTWNATNGISLKADTLNNELGKYSVFIRGDNYINEVDMASTTPVMKVSGFSEVSGSNIEVSGILDTMWGGKAPRGYDATSMFGGMINLTGAKNLVSPTTVGVGGYMNMFRGCIALTSTPALPATTLPEDCYNSMFYNCTSLTQAPMLPATTLQATCYQEMFSGCTSLTQAPTLPATTLADYCYDQMFKGCGALVNAPTLPATTLADYCYNCMFQGCESLTQAPTLPATTLTENCYHGMFKDCKLLTQVPILPATTLVKSCYEDMFRGCESLTSVPTLSMESLAESCYRAMFKGCTSLTKPMEITAMDIPTNSMVSMFEDCTSIKWATEGIPYSIEPWIVATGAMMDMFKGNSGDIPEGTGTPQDWTTYYLYTEPTEYVFTWNDAATEGLALDNYSYYYYEYITNDSAAGQDTPWFNDEWIEKVKDGRTDFTVKIMNITSKDHVVNNVSETFVYDEDYTGNGAAFKSPNAYIEFDMSDEYNPSPGMSLRYGEGVPLVFTVEWTDALKSQLTYDSTYSCWTFDITNMDTVLAVAPWICDAFSERERFGYGEGDVVKIHVVSPDGTYDKEFTFNLDKSSSSSTHVAFKSESPEGYFSTYRHSGNWDNICGSFY